MSTIDGRSFESFEQELADATRERAVLRAIVNQSPMALSLRDMDSRFIWVNSRFETLFDVNSQNCIGRLSHEVMPNPLADAISVREQEVWAGDIPKSQTHQAVIKGETHHFFASIRR